MKSSRWPSGPGVLHSAHPRAARAGHAARRGERGLELLRGGRALGAAAPPRLETIRALVELGAALRRANQRAAAREPLQRAADLARAGARRVLHERARIELAATGPGRGATRC